MSQIPLTETRPEHGSTKEGSPQFSVSWALAALSLTVLAPALATSIANAGLPSIARAFGASFRESQWILLAYLIAVTSMLVSAGRLGDLFGRKRLLMGGIAGFTAASLFCGIAPTLPLLVAARVAQGLGAAVMMALAMAMVGEIMPKARSGRAMGLMGTMSAIGTTLGPSAGGMLIAGTNWRMIFLAIVPLGFLALVLAQHHLPTEGRKNKPPRREELDVFGTLVLALTLLTYALAMTPGRGHFGPLNAGLLVAAILGTWLFIVAEAGAKVPLVRLGIFRESKLGKGLAMSVIVSAVIMTTMIVGPFYLSRGLGLEASAVGLALSVGPLGAALAGLPAGRMVDQFGPHRMAVAGLSAMAAGSSALFLIPAGCGTAAYVAPVIVITTGYALFQTANNTAVLMEIPHAHRGVASGMLGLARNLGLITGASLMGAVFAYATASTDISNAPAAAVVGGMRATFVVATILLVIAIAVAVGGDLKPGRGGSPTQR